MTNLEKLEEAILANDLNFAVYQGSFMPDEAIQVVAKYGPDVSVFDILRSEYYWNGSLVRLIGDIHKTWVNVDSLKAKDLRVDPPVGADWKTGYQKAVADFLVQNGTLVGFPESAFGWEDYQTHYPDPENPLVAVLRVQEDVWNDFISTYDGSETKTGAVAEVVFQDGTERKLRWEGSFSDIIKAIV